MTDIEKELKKALILGLDDVADFIFQGSQERVAKNSTDRGFLLASGDILSPDETTRIIEYISPYADDIEFGTDPHMPNIENLRGWCKRKLGDEGAVFAVAMKIKKHGTKPKPYLRPSIEEVKPEIQRIFQKRLKAVKNAR